MNCADYDSSDTASTVIFLIGVSVIFFFMGMAVNVIITKHASYTRCLELKYEQKSCKFISGLSE